MTELQWLIKMLTQHKLPRPIKDLFIERLGEVELQLLKPVSYLAQGSRPQGLTTGPIVQAASTQRILDEMANESPTNGIIRAATPPAKIDKETGRAMISTGKGTSGPRKF